MLQIPGTRTERSMFVMNEQMDDIEADEFMDELLGPVTNHLVGSKEEQERIEALKKEFLVKSEGFNREYSSRVFVALQNIELEFNR